MGLSIVLGFLNEFKLNGYTWTFALECKFRQSSYNGQIELANERQFNHYLKFEKEKKMPVYIALGLGGNPGYPSELFLIPLKCLRNNKISIESLSNFKKENQGQFYFDSKTNILR